MASDYGPKIVTDGLILCLDAADKVSYPTIGIATGWQDYGSNQSHYTVNGNDGVTLHSTSTGWVGRFPATVSEAGAYTVMFDYISDQGSGFVLDNDGIHDNSYNTSLAATTDPQSYTGTVNITSTGSIQFYIRRTSGGSITVTNFRYFKSDTWYDLKGSGVDGTISGCTFSTDYDGIFNFDGSNDKVDFAPSAFTTVSELSVLMWCRVESNAGSYRCFISSRTAASGVNDYLTGFNLDMLSTSTTAFNQFNIEGAGRIGGALDQMSSDSLSFGSWTHISVTKSTSVIKTKINLSAQSDRNRSDVDMGLQYICIGARYYSNSNSGYFDGDIANVHLYDRVLTDSEIQQNFNAHRSRFGV
jgi:hypothetical protein